MNAHETPMPCTTDGCETVKYFPGICNSCQREADKLDPINPSPYEGMSWVEECMRKVGVR